MKRQGRRCGIQEDRPRRRAHSVVSQRAARFGLGAFRLEGCDSSRPGQSRGPALDQSLRLEDEPAVDRRRHRRHQRRGPCLLPASSVLRMHSWQNRLAILEKRMSCKYCWRTKNKTRRQNPHHTHHLFHHWRHSGSGSGQKAPFTDFPLLPGAVDLFSKGCSTLPTPWDYTARPGYISHYTIPEIIEALPQRSSDLTLHAAVRTRRPRPWFARKLPWNSAAM